MSRKCGACTLCCKLLEVEDIPVAEGGGEKHTETSPAGSWCRQCAIGKGCKIYQDRPDGCRNFNCGWLKIDSLRNHWFPARARMVLDVRLLVDGSRREAVVVIHVDPAYQHRLKESPWVDDIRTMAREFNVVVKLAKALSSPGSSPLSVAGPPAAAGSPGPTASGS